MLTRMLWLCVATIGLATVAQAQAPGDRQYYTAWTKHATKNYYYRQYYFKKATTDTTYAHHYGIYYPSRGKRVYMYNPDTRKFWGVWDGERYSLLAKDKQKASLDDIPAEDFPPAGAAPNVPGIDDKLSMLAPPNDFPKLEP